MTQNLKKDFSNAVTDQCQKMQKESYADVKNGHYIRSAVLTMGWVSVSACDLEEISLESVKAILDLEMPAKNEVMAEINGYALDGFKKVFQQLTIK